MVENIEKRTAAGQALLAACGGDYRLAIYTLAAGQAQGAASAADVTEPTDTDRLNVLEPILRNNGLDYTAKHDGFSIRYGSFGWTLEPTATLRQKADQLIAAGANDQIVDAEVTA